LPEQSADSDYNDIDVTGATAALEERLAPSRETLEVARDTESGKFTSKPEAEDTDPPAAGDEAAVEDAATPEAETVAEAEEDAEAPFTHIPDEALSPEMLAVKRAMQADYTRKTQEIAPFRKLASEFGVESPDELRERLEIQRQLSDPQNWPRLHEELTTYLRQQGLSPQAAQDAAAVTLGQATGGIADDDYGPDDDDYVDGGLPPAVQQRLDQMEQRQNELIQLMHQREQQAQQEAEMAQLAQHLTTQENQIRAKYRDAWGDRADDYIETVYDLSGDGGDLSVGLSRLETILGYDASRYLVGKEEAKRAPGPVVGEGVIANQGEDVPHTLEEGHEQAMAYVRAQAEAEAGL
jgi:hypothetical protein